MYPQRDVFVSQPANCWLVIGLCILTGCTSSSPGPAKPPASQPRISTSIQLRDVTSSSDVNFVHQSGQAGKFLLPETMTGGLALFDYDNDNLIDIYFCSGRPLLDASGKILDISSNLKPYAGGALFRNLGNWRFVDVTANAGLTGKWFGLGVTTGDYDNDGFADLFLSNFDGDQLFHNDGTGHFENVTVDTGGSLAPKFSAGSSFVDVNADGNLDLFVARYVQLGMKDLEAQARLLRPQYPGPQDFRPETNLLLLNTGVAGGWQDVTQTSGIGRVSGTGMGCVTGDFDSDGDTDIFVANDEMPNYLFNNDGQGNFEEAGLIMGAAVNSLGSASGSMGVDAGDVDGDGLSDLLVTTFENEQVNLFRMTEQHMFQEVNRQTRVGEGTLPHVTWGCAIVDLDGDGARDIYMATGHLDQRNHNAFYHAPDIVLRNMYRESGQLRFENISAALPDIMQLKGVSRGTGCADLDGDGDQDLVVLNIDDRAAIIHNQSPPTQWLKVKLIGTQSNRDALGATIKVVTGKLAQVDQVRSGRSYQSSWGHEVHFGLANNDRCDQIEISWPNGRRQQLTNVPAGQTVTIVEE